MKNIHDVLRDKEKELRRLQAEVDTLRLAARLLAEEGDPHLESLGTLAPTGSSSELHGGRNTEGSGRRQFP